MVVKVMKNELKLNNCGFDHDPVDSMMRSQWQSKTKNTFYLIYRWLIAVVFVATVIISLYSHLQRSSFGLFFIYLTHWGITLNVIVGIYGAVLVSIWHFHSNYQATILRNNEIPISFKVYWALHNIALVTSFTITIVYWSILHKAKSAINLTGVMSHAMNSVIMYLDILIVAYPMRLYHVIQPVCFGICFAIFSYVYYWCGGLNEHGQTFIYTILNWEKPEKALITVIGVIILVVFVHMILFCIYKLRVFIQRRLFRTESVMQTPTIELNSNIC